MFVEQPGYTGSVKYSCGPNWPIFGLKKTQYGSYKQNHLVGWFSVCFDKSTHFYKWHKCHTKNVCIFFFLLAIQPANIFSLTLSPNLSTNKQTSCWYLPLCCLLLTAWPTDQVQTGLEMSQCLLACQPRCTHSPLPRPGAAIPWQFEVSLLLFLLSFFFPLLPSFNNRYLTYSGPVQ